MSADLWASGIAVLGIRINKNMRIQGVKYQQKLRKKLFYSFNPNLNFWNVRDYKPEIRKIIKLYLFLNRSTSLKMKISQKNKQQIWKILFVKKFSKSLGNDLDPDPDPFFPVRSRIKIKWILSTGELYKEN